MSIDIQMMIRDQANETRSQLHEVVSWESVIQERDDELIELAKQGKFGYTSPDTTRLQATTTTTSSKPKKVQIVNDGNTNDNEKPVETVKKGKTVPKSYEEWSKIDGKYKDFDENETDPKESAADHKEKGNNFYKKKQYASAIKEYTQAINLDSSNAIYYNNRAAAYYQLSNYVESEKDSTRAINLDGRYVKAYIRRGNSRRVQGKLQEALKDFEVANEIEPGTPEIEKQLSTIREQLGISANGRITELQEPKVKIQDDSENASSSPKVQVVEETQKKPKVEVIEEKTFTPEAEEKRNQQAKVEIVEDTEEFSNKKRPKVEVIEERSFSPQAIAEEERKQREKEEAEKKKREEEAKRQKEEEERKAKSKIEVVEETSQPSSRIKIVSEEENKPSPTPAANTEPPKSTGGKIKIVSEEEPSKPVEPQPQQSTGGKIKIVAEEEPSKPSEPQSQQQSTGSKIQIVSEEPSTPATQPKKQPRKDNISISHPELDENPPQKKPAPKKQTDSSTPPKKVVKKPKMVKPFIDLQMDEYPERLRSIKPSQLNRDVGVDVTPEIVIGILKALQGFEPGLSFQFLEQLGQHKYLSLVLAGRQAALIKPLVIELIDAAKDVDNVRKENVRKSWKI